MKGPSLKERLQFHRRNWRLLQKHVATLLGVSQSVIERYEGSRRLPSLKTALKYEILFGQSIRDLLKEYFEQVEVEVLEQCLKLSERWEGQTSHPSVRRRQFLEGVLKRLRDRMSGDNKSTS